MKKARIPILVQDPALSKHQDVRIIEGYDPQRDYFLDGPVSERVAVLDFNPESDALNQGVHFNKGIKRGFYEDQNAKNVYDYRGDEIYSSAFMQVSTFATVLKTLDLFDEKRGMGRPLTWAFNSPQLLVIPRAGEKVNAFYQRGSHSLQFFYFPSEEEEDKLVYSCLSRDIVAHETGHAIIDGIAPHLMDAPSPQSLAIHEALADIIAMLVAFRSHNLAAYILEKTHGSIKDISEFSTIAEEFGQARGHQEGLRNLLNKKNLDRSDRKNCVRSVEPHELSQVLSGALYDLMVRIHESLKDEYQHDFKDKKDPIYSASGKALGKGVYRLIRIVFRALDYLPVGCVSFIDFGRAMIAVDEVAYPDAPQLRDWVREEFLKRHIIKKSEDLSVTWDLEAKYLEGANVSDLAVSDWVAYEFANSHRELLGIPEDVPFIVHPRLDVTKRYDEDNYGHECILKVSWEQEEENIEYPTLPEKRVITVGTTVVFDWESGKVVTILSNAKPPSSKKKVGQGVFLTDQIRKDRMKEYRQQKKERDRFIRKLVEEGVLLFGQQAIGPDGKPLPSAIHTEVVNNVMRLRNTFNLLHIAEVE